MKKVSSTLSVLLIAVAILTVSCKKTYQCKATANGTESTFQCKNCTKDDVSAYQKEIEDKGYTNVNCAK